MKTKWLMAVAFYCLCCTSLPAQSRYNEEKPPAMLYGGAGMGFDYGGFGLKAEYLPVKYVGIFGGIGYNLAQMGYNAGLSFKVLPDKKVTPAIAAMYGYNAVIKITGAIEETTTYYGFTFGAGVDIKMGRKGNKLSTYLWVPVRSTDFKNDYDYAREYYNLSVITPVNASVGFNFALN